MLEGVSIEQLRTLSAVVEAGSFTAAARKLGRVQAAVSQSIDRLEGQLGLRLFDRSGRVPKLTRHGEAVAAAAARTLGDLRALEEIVLSLKRGEETSLHLAIDVMAPTESVVAFAREFRSEHPSVELVIFSDVLSGVTSHVREKRSVWGLAIEDADLSGLDYRAVADVQLVPVVAPEHPLAKEAQPLSGAALDAHVQIVLAESRLEEPQSPKGRGVFSRRTWRVVDLATKHALIAGGLGWGHLPEHLVREDLRTGRLIALELEAWGSASRGVSRSLVLARRRDVVLGPVARWAQSRLGELCRASVEPAPSKRKARHQRK